MLFQCFEEKAIYNIQNNYKGANPNATGIIAVNSNHCNFNPPDKYVEAVEEIKRLYEELLKSEREKIRLPEKFLGGNK